ncbi:MAG TPA: Hpt domain-containing protein, partial [Alphaproteobacteria bacterium]|nr:Hpt domain-containing protein [Alphaproteobacteria bacterium]
MLKSLTSGLPPEVMKDILVTFYEKADELIASIGTAYVSHNLSDLKARAHELKGMAGNFGFSEISRMCATI